MYELIILGVLMSGDKSGYALRNILENLFTTRRKISSGVLYPRLEQFSQQGWITLTENHDDPRSAKIAHLTSTGREHFKYLMAQSIPYDAKREELLHFKIQFLGSVNREVKIKILQEYKEYLIKDLQAYAQLDEHMDEHIKLRNQETTKYQYVKKAINLDLKVAKTKLNWIEEQLTNEGA